MLKCRPSIKADNTALTGYFKPKGGHPPRAVDFAPQTERSNATDVRRWSYLEKIKMIQVVEADLTLSDHAGAVVQLMDEYSRDPMGGGKALSSFVRNNLVSELRKRDSAHVILAFVDGKPAGLVICLEGFSTFACRPLLNVHDAIVSVEHRGRGLCKCMLRVAEAVAHRLGCCKMTLEVLEGNVVAQAAYKSCGFAGYELDPRMGKAMFWEKKL